MRIQTRIWSRKGGYDWGAVESNKSRELTPAEVAKLKALLAPLSLKVLKAGEDFRGRDGSQWTLSFSNLEGDSVTVWTPEESTKERKLEAYHAFGRLMWSLSDGPGDLY